MADLALNETKRLAPSFLVIPFVELNYKIAKNIDIYVVVRDHLHQLLLPCRSHRSNQNPIDCNSQGALFLIVSLLAPHEIHLSYGVSSKTVLPLRLHQMLLEVNMMHSFEFKYNFILGYNSLKFVMSISYLWCHNKLSILIALRWLIARL